MSLSEKAWHLECQSWSHMNILQQHKELGDQQHEIEQNWSMQQNQQPSVGLEAEIKGDGLQSLAVDLPRTEKNILPLAVEVDINVKNTALESYTDISATNKELLHLLDGNCSLSLNLNGRYQPSVESTKESRSSLTAALKKLNKLLVISENTSVDVICQPEMIAESPTGVKDVEKSRPKVSISWMLKINSIHKSALIRPRLVENVNFRGPGDGMSGGREHGSNSGKLINKSSSLKHFTSCTYLRQRNFTQALRSCMWVKDLDQSPENPLTGLKPEKMSVLKLLSNLLPLIFPTAAWILQAGFSLQEALEALHQVGRNADLPFLVLLAKNVVVPM
ncbi:hypothetical protein E2I00_006966 [Balaenoptera physalus]|uniref:Uncharacterized protein n=1 Tax=Balaenoptera physalus TaxID=9770 RepID=A0A6A1QA07_BALPH|nr:hypothetical protein E2I00_006966 [Balaenoptera physalus]